MKTIKNLKIAIFAVFAYAMIALIAPISIAEEFVSETCGSIYDFESYGQQYGNRYKNGIEFVDYLLQEKRRTKPNNQFCLGQEYEVGRYVPKNFLKAAEQYAMASDNGHIYARYRLAIMHLKGKGMIQDSEKAHELLTEAAYLGHPGAQIALAEKLLLEAFQGNDPEENKYELAYVWYSLASIEGYDIDNPEWQKTARIKSKSMEVQMSRQQIQDAQVTSEQLFREIRTNQRNYRNYTDEMEKEQS